jgi:hypothetical protein
VRATGDCQIWGRCSRTLTQSSDYSAVSGHQQQPTSLNMHIANIDNGNETILDPIRTFNSSHDLRAARSLPSPVSDHPRDELVMRQWATKHPRKTVCATSVDTDERHLVLEKDDMHLALGRGFASLSECTKLDRLIGFCNLTSITAPALLPWHIMCLSNLQACTINVEVKRCARFDFAVPESARIPSFDAIRSCNVQKLIAQVPIEFLDDGIANNSIFAYLPTLVSLAPELKHLALQLTRKEGTGRCPGNDVHRSYDMLLRNLHSICLETLVIDTCDVEAGAVRQCQGDFFETIHPITSLDSFPRLRRIVAPQEAFMWVNGRLDSKSSTEFVAATILFSDSIERVEIIDSTTALNKWAESVLTAWQANSGIKISTLSNFDAITLWCDRWYPTLVPDFRVDE